MKYVCTEPFRCYRGYAFINGKPVDVTDKGTLDLIDSQPGFKRYEEPKVEVKRPVLSLAKRK